MWSAFPSSQRRGGAKRRGGRFGETLRRSDHPVCATLVASRHFFNGAASLPLRGGEYITKDDQVTNVNEELPPRADRSLFRGLRCVSAADKRRAAASSDRSGGRGHPGSWRCCWPGDRRRAHV